MTTKMNSVMSPMRMPTPLQPRPMAAAPGQGQQTHMQQQQQQQQQRPYHAQTRPGDEGGYAARRMASSPGQQPQHAYAMTNWPRGNRMPSPDPQRLARQHLHDRELRQRHAPQQEPELVHRQQLQLQPQLRQRQQRQLQHQHQHQHQQPLSQQHPRQQQLPPPHQRPQDVVAWRVAVDPKTKRPYYYHPVTRETTWKKPVAMVEQEKRERAQFFATMESNIRSKLRAGHWFRDSLTSQPTADEDEEDDHDNGNDKDDVREPEHEQDHDHDHDRDDDDGVVDLASSTTTSTSCRSSLSSSTDVKKAPALLEPTVDLTNQTENGHGEDDEGDEDTIRAKVIAARVKAPMLFRTLSSYETPVVGATKTLPNGNVVAIPSPIQERVRLAVMDDRTAPTQHQRRSQSDKHLMMQRNQQNLLSLHARASDTEAYMRSDLAGLVDTLVDEPVDTHGVTDAAVIHTPVRPSLSASALGGVFGNATLRTPLRRRSNSTSTIFVRMGTMNAPDQDTTIQCVATVLRAHLMEAQAAPLVVDPRFAILVNARDLHANVVPSLQEIGAFITHVFSRAQMESECIIMSLIYVERLLKATMGALQLQPGNWRCILFCSMVMASKVWDDLSMCNADFSKIWPELSLREINELELVYLGAVEYNVRVSAVSYAKYYFHLRSMCASMGMLAAFDESAPLNLEGARKMQVLSEEYQERSKLMPAPRRRSVTITTTIDSEGCPLALHSRSWTPATASPAASLEQLVHMQVRGAGGATLSSLHRVTAK